SGYMGFVKGRTAIRLFNKFPYLRKKKLWGNHFWQRGLIRTSSFGHRVK
ncbi:transposase, partial [Vibrio fluvialis]|nr:transposase [Vibrio fluvialis]MBY8105462.1 transposase [Vibrio fluvialis]